MLWELKKEISVEIGEIPIKEGQNILICTDGLHNTLDAKKILKILNEKESIILRGNELVEKANANGGHDNITFILIENDKEKE